MVHYESCPCTCIIFRLQVKIPSFFFIITKMLENVLTLVSDLFFVSNQPFFRIKSLIIVPGLGDVEFRTACGLINNVVVGKSVS